MKILVTGGSGFVGSRLIDNLSKRGVEIVALTRNAGKLNAWRNEVQVIEMDIGQVPPNRLDYFASFDVLIHLAWDGLPNYRSLRHFEIELDRQYRFLKSMIVAGLPSVVVTGTCLEYGMQSGVLCEGMVTRPSIPYGFAKDALRRQLEFLKTEKPFALTWARLFYIYGDGQSQVSLLSQLRAAISRGEKTFDMSGGEQLRDYLHVDEVARLLVELALQHSNSGSVNVCAGVPISIRRLVEMWIKDNAWEIELRLGSLPYPDYEPMAFWGSRSKLDSLLGNV